MRSEVWMLLIKVDNHIPVPGPLAPEANYLRFIRPCLKKLSSLTASVIIIHNDKLKKYCQHEITVKNAKLLSSLIVTFITIHSRSLYWILIAFFFYLTSSWFPPLPKILSSLTAHVNHHYDFSGHYNHFVSHF